MKQEVTISKDEKVPNIFYWEHGILKLKICIHKDIKRISIKTFDDLNEFEVINTKCDTKIQK